MINDCVCEYIFIDQPFLISSCTYEGTIIIGYGYVDGGQSSVMLNLILTPIDVLLWPSVFTIYMTVPFFHSYCRGFKPEPNSSNIESIT